MDCPALGPVFYLGTGKAIEVNSSAISWRAALLGHLVVITTVGQRGPLPLTSFWYPRSALAAAPEETTRPNVRELGGRGCSWMPASRRWGAFGHLVLLQLTLNSSRHLSPLSCPYPSPCRRSESVAPFVH